MSTEDKSFRKAVTIAATRTGMANAYQANLIARRLVAIGKTTSLLAVAACNRGLTPQEEKTVRRAERDIVELAALIGLEAYYQSDPRGNTVRVKVPADLADYWDDTVGCG